MKPVSFKGNNIIFAEDQPEYLPLPACRSDQGEVLTCWKLSYWERIKVLFTGRVWCTQLTFNRPLQPQMLQVLTPVIEII